MQNAPTSDGLTFPAANASWMAPLVGQNPGEQLNWVGMAATAGAGGTM